MRRARIRAPSVFCLNPQSLQVMASVRPGRGRMQPQSGQKEGSATSKGDDADSLFFFGRREEEPVDMLTHAHAH